MSFDVNNPTDAEMLISQFDQMPLQDFVDFLAKIRLVLQKRKADQKRKDKQMLIKEAKEKKMEQRNFAKGIILQTAKENGLVVNIRVTKTAVRRTGYVMKKKYANPENPADKWSGTGKRPKWMDAYLSKGGSIADCQIERLTTDGEVA